MPLAGGTTGRACFGLARASLCRAPCLLCCNPRRYGNATMAQNKVESMYGNASVKVRKANAAPTHTIDYGDEDSDVDL